MLGTNDSAIEGPTGSPVSPENYRRNLRAIIDRLLTDFPDCRIVIHRPTWYSPNTHNGSTYMAAGLERLQAYFPQIDALVSQYRATRPGHVFAGDREAFDFFKANAHKYLNPEAGQDGVFYLHPNDAGAPLLATFWAIGIKNALQGEK
jgi:lysophospholipase L1-like esterase